MIELSEGLWWRIGLWPAVLIENRYKNGDVETRLFVEGCRDPFVAVGLTAVRVIERIEQGEQIRAEQLAEAHPPPEARPNPARDPLW